MSLLGRLRSWLFWKGLWLRHVWPFYWAHKPLCGRFRQDVLRVGGVYLCRSCTLAYAGLGLGLLLGVVMRDVLREAGAAPFVGFTAVTLAFSFPAWYKGWARPVRDVLRAMMGLTIAWCGCLLLVGQIATGLIGAVVLAVFWKGYLTVRRRRLIGACHGCAALDRDEICPGFALQAEAIRRYEQAATERILADGYVPRPAPE
ncbi:MAG: hypothetical protein JXB62_21585 [Pirellulales bacterium]|nr:hypothetical protein [Pirellulales bacterium]